MPIEKCDCEKWTDIVAHKGGRPVCEIPMTVKDFRGTVIPGQLPPMPKRGAGAEGRPPCAGVEHVKRYSMHLVER